MGESDLPFSSWLGLSTDGDDVCLLPDSPHLNQLGSVHATVIFALAEAAAERLLRRRFPAVAGAGQLELDRCDVKYQRPAIPGATLRGQAVITDELLRRLPQALDRDGRVTVDVPVRVVQDGIEVSRGSCTWRLSAG